MDSKKASIRQKYTDTVLPRLLGSPWAENKVRGQMLHGFRLVILGPYDGACYCGKIIFHFFSWTQEQSRESGQMQCVGAMSMEKYIRDYIGFTPHERGCRLSGPLAPGASLGR